MYDRATLVVQSRPSGARKVVQRDGYHGRYLQSGHLVYIHDGTLRAAPVDAIWTRVERGRSDAEREKFRAAVDQAQAFHQKLAAEAAGK